MYNFDDTVVRILEVNLKNYKNVSNGTIKIENIANIEEGKGNILGIYGQNGSGKTSIIKSIKIIKDIFCGSALPKDINEHIMYGKGEAEVNILFYIIDKEKRYKVNYDLVILKDDKRTFIKEESIHYWSKKNVDDEWDRVKGLLISKYDKDEIYPKYRNEELLKVYDEKSLAVNKIISFRENKSFIFSKELLLKIKDNSSKVGEEYEVLEILKEYAKSSLYIIDNKNIALSDANILLSMNFKKNGHNGEISMGVIPIGLDKPTYLPRESVSEIENSLKLSNRVISEIIPELEIKLKELRAETSIVGEEVLVELLSCKDSMDIPMRYESDGIKKIVAVIHLLIAMFNYRSMTILIDELDSGIFEYLLGEILGILEEMGKGQLIFTSHNLRPLEVLNKNNLVFTTTNKNNRYIKLKNVRSNNNLRDMYYRDLILGGQEEIIYDTTNSARISRAFRKAGK